MARQLTLKDVYHVNPRSSFNEMDEQAIKLAQMEALLSQACSDFEGRVRELGQRLAHTQDPISMNLCRQFRIISICALKAAKRSKVFPFPFLGQDMDTMGNAYAEIMKVVVNDYLAIEENYMNEIRMLLATLVGSLNSQNVVEVHKHNPELSHGADESRALWDRMGTPRQDLILKSLHILGLDACIEAAARYRYVPKKVMKSYESWRSQNAAWMAAKPWLVPKAKMEPCAVISLPVRPVIVPPVIKPASQGGTKTVQKTVLSHSDTDRAGKTKWFFDEKPLQKPNRIADRLKARALSAAAASNISDPLDDMDWDELERLTAPDNVSSINQDVAVDADSLPVVACESVVEETPSIVLPSAKGHIGVLPGGMVIDSGHDHHEDEVHHGYAGAFKAAVVKSVIVPYQKGALLYDHLSADERVERVEYLIGSVSASEPYPLSLLDVTLKNGAAARIVLRNFTNFATYVDRAPQPYMKGDPLDVESLRDRMDVWKFRYKGDDAFCQKIDYYLHTPIPEIPLQVKRDLSWPGHGMDALMSLRDYVLENHCLPSAADTSPICHGPLAYKTTWCGVASMLKRGTVEELRDVKSIPTLHKKAIEHFPALQFVTLERRHPALKL